MAIITTMTTPASARAALRDFGLGLGVDLSGSTPSLRAEVISGHAEGRFGSAPAVAGGAKRYGKRRSHPSRFSPPLFVTIG